MRKELEANFTPIYYSIGDKTPDPLATLVKMYERSNIALVDENLSQTIKEYMVDCYDTYLNLDAVVPIPNPPKLVNKTAIYDGLWNAVKVDYNFITTTFYSAANPEGVEKDCPWVWGQVNNDINIAGGTFGSKLINYTRNRGITLEAIDGALSMIFASGPEAPSNPYSVMSGLFLSMAMRDGITQGGLKVWGDKMVFEAHRKRVFEKAGERNIFLMVMIPVITAIENFSFFIAPLMMLLSVMGGTGLKFIGKYLMLVLFVNLWGFVKIFTDLFTALSVEKAFSTASVVNPFAFGAYPETFAEIEGLLATSANLTTSIPMLVMFLLYGGIHSVMGVMNGLTKGSVDGENMAPKISSTMNGGVVNGGDRTSHYINGSRGAWAGGQISPRDYSIPGFNVKNQTGSAAAASSIIAQNESTGHARTASTQIIDAVTNTDTSHFMQNGQITKSFDSLTGVEQLAALKAGYEQNGRKMTDEQLAALVKVGGQGEGGFAMGLNTQKGQRTISSKNDDGSIPTSSKGSGVRLNFGGDVYGAIEASGRAVDSETASEMRKFLEDFTKNNKNVIQAGDGQTSGTSVSDAELAKRDASLQSINQSLEQYSKSVERKDAITKSATDAYLVERDYPIRTSIINEIYNSKGEAFEEMYKQLWQDNEKRMESHKLPQSAAEFLSELGGNPSPTNAVLKLDSVFTRANVGMRIDSLEEQKQDLNMASNMWRQVGETVGLDDVKVGLNQLADSYDRIAASTEFDAKELSEKSTSPSNRIMPEEKFDEQIKKIERDAQDTEAKVTTQQGSIDNNIDGVKSVVKKEFNESGFETPQPLSEIDENYKMKMSGYDARQITRDNWVGGAKMGLSLAEKISDLASFFGKTGVLWGHNAEERAKVFASQAHEAGNFSNHLEKGFAALATLDQTQINNLYRNGRLNEQAYAINDVYSVIPNLSEEVVQNLGKTEDGKRFAAAVNHYKAFRDALPDEVRNRLDAITELRNNKGAPDVVTDELIKNTSGQQLDEAKNMFKQDVASAASVYLKANPEYLKNSEAIRSMSGFKNINDIDMDDTHFIESRNALREGAIDSQTKHLVKANSFDFDGEKFTQGVNAKVSSSKIAAHLADLANQAENGDLFAQHRFGAAQTYGLTTNSLGKLMDNLEAAGFKGKNNALEYSELVLSHALVEGVISTNKTNEENVKAFKDYVQTGNFSALGSNAYERLQVEGIAKPVISASSYDPKGTRATAEGTATSPDGRVRFTAEASASKERFGSRSDVHLSSIVESDAKGAVITNLRGINAYDQLMNRAFNEQNTGLNPPENFKTDANVQFKLQGQREDGKYIYSDGKGTFTYTPGDDRLMPLDHKYYATKK